MRKSMRKRRKPRRRKIEVSARASRKKEKRRPGKRAKRKKPAIKRRVVKKRAGRKSAASRVNKGGRKARARKTVKRRRRRKVRVPQRPARKFTRKSVAPKPIYTLNPGFEFFYELRDLVLKSSPAEKDRIVEKLNRIGRVKLAIISGVFINKENLDPLITDLFIVGDDIDRRRLRAFLRAVEAEVGKEVRFAVMDKEEFQYRLAMFDRFVRVLLESPHEKLINRLGI